MSAIIALDNDCLRYVKTPLEHAIVTTESTFNPFAIGVVNGYLQRQPRNLEEAVATALELKAKGFNYSMGCRQVNQANLARYGLDHVSVFDPARNSSAGAAIYDECRNRAAAKFGDGISATRAALSCYYSGNFTYGQQMAGNSISYADKVLGKLPVGSRDPASAIPVTATKPAKVRQRPQPKATGAGNTEPAPASAPDRGQTANWDVLNDF